MGLQGNDIEVGLEKVNEFQYLGPILSAKSGWSKNGKSMIIIRSYRSFFAEYNMYYYNIFICKLFYLLIILLFCFSVLLPLSYTTNLQINY